MTRIDEFIQDFNKISILLKCGPCDDCERDIVYLLPFEVERFRSLKNPSVSLTQVDGIYYLKKDEDYCPFRDKIKRKCKIYLDRPICCRMFPLEISSRKGFLEWVVYDHCPKVRGEQGRHLRNALSIYSREIECCLTEDLLNFYYKEDTVTTRIEFLGGFSPKAIPLRPVGGTYISYNKYNKGV